MTEISFEAQLICMRARLFSTNMRFNRFALRNFIDQNYPRYPVKISLKRSPVIAEERSATN